MDTHTVLYMAFVYLVAAVVAVPTAKKLGLGSVLGYLIAGIIIGPSALALVGQEYSDVMHAAEFGVVMMLFLVGLELDPRRLWQLRNQIFGLGASQVIATTVLIALLSHTIIGLEIKTAIAIGLIFSMSSTALVLQTLQDKGLLKTSGGQSVFSVLLFQDIAVIPILIILPLLALSEVIQTGDKNSFAQPWLIVGAVVAIILAGRFLVRPLFRFVATSGVREAFTALALLIVIGVTLTMEAVGLSAALGTFLAGIVLADSEYRHQLEADIEPFKALLLGLFFIAVGASIDFGLIAAAPLKIGCAVIVLIGAKFLVLFAIARSVKFETARSLLFAVSLAQGGEFAFVLSSYAFASQVLTGEQAAFVNAIVALSLAAAPLMFLALERVLLPRFTSAPLNDTREPDTVDEHNHIIIAGFGGFGSTIGRLLRANGIHATVLESDAPYVELLRKVGLKVFYGDAAREDLLRAAGAEHASILIIAIGDPTSSNQIFEIAKHHFPHLKIFARASTREHAYGFIKHGVHSVFRDTLGSALDAGELLLKEFGLRAYQARRSTQLFREIDESLLRKLALLKDDQSSYLAFAKQSIQDLENLLNMDIENQALNRDAGWDPAPSQTP